MIFLTILTIALILALLFARRSDAHLVTKPAGPSLQQRERSQMTNLYHARYVCRHGARQHRHWSCLAKRWLARELHQTRALIRQSHPRSHSSTARARTIAAAEIIRSRGGNPWPNCPDPNDGASWDATKACESGSTPWDQDPPGYFCGPLQFDPHVWGDLIRKYGIPC